MKAHLLAILLILLPVLASTAADKKEMPREDVVEAPAIGTGLCVSNAFQTNMVLQRDKALVIWGWADPGEEVTVSFAGQEAKSAAAADRSWQVSLKPIPANNTPQIMTVKGKNTTLSLENVLVGDVWVLGGQSNMEFPINKVDDGEMEVVSANFPRIRLLTVPNGKGFASVHSFERLHEWSDWSKRHFHKGVWEICSPGTVPDFSAIGYVFGRRIHMASDVPIGLINASIGGTTVETWTPDDVLQKIDGAETRALLKDWSDRIASFDPQADLKTRIAGFENRMKNLKEKGQPIPADSAPPKDLRPGPAADRSRPGYCYASVIKPLQGLAVAGAVFHQGFNNCFNGSAGARMYYQVFAKMISAWRNTFGDAQMPFCIISLPTAGEPQTLDNFLAPMLDAGAYVREAQYRTFLDLRKAGDKNIGFVSVSDLRKSWYHPQIKIPAGERAAKWALVTRYGILKGRDAEEYWLPPTITKVEPMASALRLTMSTDMKTHDDSDGRMLGFAVAGKDGRYFPAEVNWFTDGTKGGRNKLQYEHNILIASSPFVPEPLYYRYAWARNPMGNIVNSRGVPLPGQRNDDWNPEDSPGQAAVSHPPEEAAKKSATVQLRKELEQADMERRLKEAEASIAKLKPVLERSQTAARKKDVGKTDGEK